MHKKFKRNFNGICNKNEFDNEEKLKKLIICLDEDGAQYTEFAAFMNAFDVSISTF